MNVLLKSPLYENEDKSSFCLFQTVRSLAGEHIHGWHPAVAICHGFLQNKAQV